MAKTGEKIFSTLDIYLSAFLILHDVQPELKTTNGRVTFNFKASDDLYKWSLAYNSNEPVPVADYVTTVKTLRGQMLTMRGQK